LYLRDLSITDIAIRIFLLSMDMRYGCAWRYDHVPMGFDWSAPSHTIVVEDQNIAGSAIMSSRPALGRLDIAEST
jgi:hypothetical protein